VGEDIGWKLRHIFLPVLLLMLLLPPVYVLAVWLLEEAGLALNREMAAIWLPGALSFGLVSLLVQRNLNTLKFPAIRNIDFLYLLFASIAVAIPVGVLNWGVHAMLAKAESVTSSASVRADDGISYYITNSICIDRERDRLYPTVRRDARSGRLEAFEAYIVAPVCNQTGAPVIWLGLRYSESADNRLPAAALDAAYRSFFIKSERAFEGEAFASFHYLEKLVPSDERRNFLHAVTDGYPSDPSAVIIVPHKEVFTRQTEGATRVLLWSLSIAVPLWFAMLLIVPLDHRKLARRKTPSEMEERRAFSFLYWPSRGNYGAAILIDLNVLVFVAMAFSGLGVVLFEPQDLLVWGASSGAMDHGWGLFRLFTSQFVHTGLMHLANNMCGLAFACLFLVPVANNAKLIACYLISGLGGSLMSVAIHPNMISVGASGAIMGLYGILIVLTLARDPRFKEARTAILSIIGISLVLTFLIGSFSSNVDNAAHIGGLLTGTALGIIFWLRGDTSRVGSGSARTQKRQSAKTL
jgi:rhomboid protease GluP